MADLVNIRLLPDDLRIQANRGMSISEAAELAGVYLTHPCGGKGTCGRCTVFADGQAVKACVTPVEEGMTVHIPNTVRLTGQTILTDIRLYAPEKNALPRVQQMELVMPEPSLTDAASDELRVRMELARQLEMKIEDVHIELPALAELPHTIRNQGFHIYATVIHENGGVTILNFSRGPLYGMAVDIGTTTVVVALCDLTTGFVHDTYAAPNPQANYGSDVINRVVYTEENEGGLRKMQQAIIVTLMEGIKALTEKAQITAKSIPVMTIAANSVMSHFLLGLPCENLRREPYVPAAFDYPVIRPSDIGLPIMSHGRVIVLPGIASYVGGDITAGVLATELDKLEGINMLVDVGTNGEMVLSVDGSMMACSCSAGPAFEGSGISCGSRAVRGAIDNVYYHKGHMVYDIIGGHSVEPTSLCGSGLISFLSAMLQAGIIDRSGRFTGGADGYELAPRVTITQPDIMNLIRAKAAIFAGMRMLVNTLGITMADIDHIYIAGGFGRSLNVGYATNIGMFPPLPKESYSYMGNTSLAGALRVLNDRSVDASGTAGAITNIELSVGNEFMEEFTMACFLPHTDMSFYTDK